MSLGGKYLFGFAYVYLDQLQFCVVCVDIVGYVYAAVDECDEPPSLFVFPVCTYGDVVSYFLCFKYMCVFCFWYCDVCLPVVYDFFSTSILFPML